MIQEANGNDLLIGRGTVFFDRFDADGNSTGFRFVGECDKVDITPSVTVKEYYTSTKRSNNKIANVATQQKHTLAISLRSFKNENVALALLGDTAIATQAMTTVTNEVIAGGAGQAAPMVGRSYQTKMRNISALTLVGVPTGESPTPIAMVAGTDYQIEDASTGLITLLTVPVTAVTIKATTYTAAADTATKVTAGTDIQIIGAWLFIGDPTSGPKMNAKVWKSEVSPSGALSLISDDFGAMTLSAEALDDSANHPDSPLYEVIYPSV